MAPLLPPVLAVLEGDTGARFDLVAVANTLFGEAVTSAGLLPGAGIAAALRTRRDLDFALLPAEAVNDDLRFIDDVDVHALARDLPMPVRLSYDFADALDRSAVAA